jgi:hypothetical protein
LSITGLAGDRIKLGDDVVTGLAANEDAAHRAGRTDSPGRLAALDFGGRRIRHVRAVAFAGVNDQTAGGARRPEHRLQGLYRGLEQTDVVAERLAEPARLEEIALHVDDQECRALERDGERLRLGGDQGFHGLSLAGRRWKRASCARGDAGIFANAVPAAETGGELHDSIGPANA